MAPLFNEFRQFRLARGEWGAGTAQGLKEFDDYCAHYYPDHTVPTQEITDNWCARKESENANSCRTRTNAMRQLVIWAADHDIAHVALPPLPKAEAKTSVPHAFTQDELKDFFETCDTMRFLGTEQAVALKRIVVPVIFRVLYSTGMRPPEVRLLATRDVDLVSGIISIKHSKTPDQHYVVLHDSLRTLLVRYDRAANRLIPGRRWFFPDPNDNPYGRDWLRDTCRYIAKKSGIGSCRPYDFRHNYATTNINRWIGLGLAFDDCLVYLSKSMGHRSLESTAYYYSLVPALADVLNELNDARDADLYPKKYEED